MATNTVEAEEFAIKVAVRIRPMSEKEVNQGAQNIVTFSDGKVDIKGPNDKTARTFNFDYSYSQDTSQEKIFEDIGIALAENCQNGYNGAVFAYGQTGTGKSHTIFGNEETVGLCPRVSEELFRVIENSSSENNYHVTVSALEVYNENIRDLLRDTSRQNYKQFRVRENKMGVYVMGLSLENVTSFKDASEILERALMNRNIAHTMMNSSSSRGHVIIGFEVRKVCIERKITLLSNLKFVDLAGSERSSNTGATGIRLKEGANINRSLNSLGNVIYALYKRAQGEKKVLIPYRDSVITRLLQNELGGNSRTIIICTASPADTNFDETLSTFRYGSRLIQVKNMTKVNMSPTDKLINDLQDENERLKKLLSNEQIENVEANTHVVPNEQKNQTVNMTPVDKLIYELHSENDKLKQILSNKQTKNEVKKVQEKTKTLESEHEAGKQVKMDDRTPHLRNLHEDSTISGKIFYPIEKGSKLIIGNPRDTSEKPDIILIGPSIAVRHAALYNEDGSVSVLPIEGDVYVDGKKIRKTDTQLKHNDRLMFGGNNLGLYVFKDPLEEAELKKKNSFIENVNFDFAQREIARYADVEIYLSTEDIYLKEQVVRLEQNVKEANGMAKELKRPVIFDIVLISAIGLGEVKDMCHIFIQGRHEKNGIHHEFLWTEGDFYDRFAMMSTEYGKIYVKVDETEDEEEKSKDPFVEPEESAALIGVVFIPLMGLSNLQRTEDMFSIESTRTNGYVNIGVCPCDSQGREINDYRDPMELVGHQLNFKIKIDKAKGLPEKYLQTWCQYKFYMDPEDVETPPMTGQNPNFEFCKQYTQNDVTHNFIDYLESTKLIIQVFGKEKALTMNDQGEGNQIVESLREKIKELRERKKIKHDKMEQKKKENRELKEIIKNKEAILEKITEKANASKDPLAKEILEILKDNS